MVIAKDPSYLSLTILFVLSSVAYHFTLCSNTIGTHNETIIDNEYLSASIILLYMYQPKRIPYINCIILAEGVVNRTIHKYICMYVCI